MKSLVFDTSSIISIVTNDLLWVFNPLKKIFNGEFYVPYSVRLELVDKPITSKRFKLEAIMINKIIDDHVLNVYNELNVNDLLDHINNIYLVDKKPVKIVSLAEVEALALVLRLQASAYVVDERTMRLVIEDPEGLRILLEKKLHTKVEVNKDLLKELQHIVNGVNVIRSTELLTITYEKGFLNQYITSKSTEKDLIDGFLWGLRLNGCAISTEEIDEIIRLETR